MTNPILDYINRQSAPAVPKKRGAKKQFSAEELVQRQRDRMASTSRQRSALASDMGEIPDPVDPQRRERCEADFALWSATYCQPRHACADSTNHERMKDRLQSAMESKDGWFGMEAPRGEAKTTLVNEAFAWAVGKGLKRFIMMFASSASMVDSSKESFGSIYSKLPLLQEDYPEICVPLLQKLGRAKQSRLTYHGLNLRIRWGDYDKGKSIFLFPNVPCSPSNGALVIMQAINSRFRGMQFVDQNGRPVRPDVAYFDDIQDQAIAANPKRVENTWVKMTVDAAGLSGDSPMPIINTGTPFHDECLMSRTMKDRRFQSVVLKSIYKLPDRMDLWDQYQRLWENAYDDGINRYGFYDANRASAEAYTIATEFYKQNRADMDAGLEMSWQARYETKYSGASAVENIMREYLIILGPDAFEQEKNCNTQPRIDTDVPKITDELFLNKINHSLKRLVSPNDADFLTAAIDVHDSILYYEVVAWEQGYDGHIIDYGVWPEQRGRKWSVNRPQTSMADRYPGTGKSGALFAGLDELITVLVERKYSRSDGSEIPLQKILVDHNNGLFQPTVNSIVDEHKYKEKLVKYWGRRYAGGTQEKKKGEKGGIEWKWVGHGKNQIIAFRDFWKTYNQDRWLTARGELGCKTIYAGGISQHRRFYDELIAQVPKWIALSGGQQILRWPDKCDTDDHFGDVDFMATLCAAVCGIKQKTEKAGRRTRVETPAEWLTPANPEANNLAARKAKLRNRGFRL